MTSHAAKFTAILALEDTARAEHALSYLGSDHITRARNEKNYASTKAKLFALLDSLTPEEATEYTQYRKSMRAAS